MPKRWNQQPPTLGELNIEFSGTVIPQTTACKHGIYACEKCGTTDRRDTLHTTKNGRGRVARIKRGK
jgi:hypothetical protein